MKNKHNTDGDIRHEHIANALQENNDTDAPQPKFTVRGEHNVWHVYRNDERLEPPFRNQQRAEIEKLHHERSHTLRNERNQR